MGRDVKLLAVIFAVQVCESRIGGPTWFNRLLEHTVARTESIPSVLATVVLSDDELAPSEVDGSKEDICEHGNQSGVPTLNALSPGQARRKLAAIVARNKSAGSYCGILLIDPFFALLTRAHTMDCASLYCSQITQPRPWTSVVSMSPVPNHFHPKKVLCEGRDGSLRYFDPEGCNIYRRQQLESDPLFIQNGAACVVDPLKLAGTEPENRILGYVMDEPMPRVRTEKELNLVCPSGRRV